MPMTFREQVKQDFLETFLNQDEFGETCLWNDTVLQFVEAVAPEAEVIFANGVDQQTRRIICAKEALTPWPVANEAVTIDGEEWRVIRVQTPYDNLVIDIERFVS